MAQVSEIAKSPSSVSEKTTQATKLAVDKAVEKTKNSSSTASAVKSFIAGNLS